MTEKISSKKEKLLKGVALMGIATAALTGCKAEGTAPTTPSSEVTQTQTDTPTAPETTPPTETTPEQPEASEATPAPEVETEHSYQPAEYAATREILAINEFNMDDSDVYHSLPDHLRQQVDKMMAMTVDEFVNTRTPEFDLDAKRLFVTAAAGSILDEYAEYYDTIIDAEDGRGFKELYLKALTTDPEEIITNPEAAKNPSIVNRADALLAMAIATRGGGKFQTNLDVAQKMAYGMFGSVSAAEQLVENVNISYNIRDYVTDQNEEMWLNEEISDTEANRKIDDAHIVGLSTDQAPGRLYVTYDNPRELPEQGSEGGWEYGHYEIEVNRVDGTTYYIPIMTARITKDGDMLAGGHVANITPYESN